VVLSTYGQAGSEPAGDLVPAMALAKQLEKMGQVMSDSAKLHETVKLAAEIGTHEASKSFIDEEAAPFKAIRKVVSGMVDELSPEQAAADAAAKTIIASEDRLTHTTDPIVAIAAKAGLSVNAGQDLQMSAKETISSASGKDTHFATGANLRIHSGQAIGMLAGAIAPGKEAVGKGITIIAARKDIEIQAQSDTMQIASKGDMLIESENGHIDFAAAKRIIMRVSGGASITIEGGNIIHACPGTFTVLAGHKSFLGPSRVGYPFKPFPKVPFETKPFKLDFRLQDIPGPDGVPLAHAPREIVLMRGGMDFDRVLFKGDSDEKGRLVLTDAQQKELAEVYSRRPQDVWIATPGELRELTVNLESEDWSAEKKATQAMAALDYSDREHWSLGAGEPENDESISKLDSGKSAFGLWNDIKKI
jgi:type VI secretion system secreted protein VgrG